MTIQWGSSGIGSMQGMVQGLLQTRWPLELLIMAATWTSQGCMPVASDFRPSSAQEVRVMPYQSHKRHSSKCECTWTDTDTRRCKRTLLEKCRTNCVQCVGRRNRKMHPDIRRSRTFGMYYTYLHASFSGLD